VKEKQMTGFDPIDAMSRLVADLLAQSWPASPPSVAQFQLGLGIPPDADAATVKAALEAALQVSGVTVRPADPGLAERIADVLLGARFHEYDAGNPVAAAVSGAFVVGAGVGATVRVSWRNTDADTRAAELLKYGYVLRRAGLQVDIRTGYLYVHEGPPPALDERH
jgi:hypothetical protein